MAANVAGSDREIPATIQSSHKHSHPCIRTKLNSDGPDLSSLADTKEQKRLGGKTIENPAAGLSRARIAQKELRLPEREQFKTLVSVIRTDNSNAWGPKAADLVEFLASGGFRLYTEAQLIMGEDIDWQRKEIIVRGDPQNDGTKNGEMRRVPIIPDMEELLKRIQTNRGGEIKGKVLEIVECPILLQKACAKVGIPKLTHHGLRHLFATRCIESGVDIPTVSKWLGHKDGGALAMKVCGHLRNEHSQAMADSQYKTLVWKQAGVFFMGRFDGRIFPDFEFDLIS